MFWNGRAVLGGSYFGGVEDVAPIEVEEKEIVVRLLGENSSEVARKEEVAVGVVMEEAEDVAVAVETEVAEVEAAAVAEAVVVVQDKGKGKMVEVEEDWTVVRRKVREREMEKRRRFEREELMRRMNVWHMARRVVPLQEVVAQEKVMKSSVIQTEGQVMDVESLLRGAKLEIRNSEWGMSGGRLVKGREIPTGLRLNVRRVGERIFRGLGRLPDMPLGFRNRSGQFSLGEVMRSEKYEGGSAEERMRHQEKV